MKLAPIGLICGLLFGLAGCGGGAETLGESGCQNFLGSDCEKTVPEGKLITSTEAAVEGKSTLFDLNIFDRDPADEVICSFDPLGNGSASLKILCPSFVSYVYQESGQFQSSVTAVDKQGNVLEDSSPATVAEDNSSGRTKITHFRLFDTLLRPIRNAIFCIRPVGAPSGCSPLNITEGPPPGTYFVVPGLPIDNPDATPFKIIVTQGSGAERVSATLIGRVDADNIRSSVDFSLPFFCPESSNNCTAKTETVERRGIISGFVTSLGTGAPIAGAEIQVLFPKEKGTFNLQNPDADADTVWSGVSGDNGQFEVETAREGAPENTDAEKRDPREGVALVRVRADGYKEAISTIQLDFIDAVLDPETTFSSTYFFGLNFALEPQAASSP